MNLFFFSSSGWGLKALSVFFTIKIKLVLLLLFVGGGVFYGMKVWQGTALGCPEPLIQEVVKHHDHDILPYHGHFGESFSPYVSGGDFSGAYSYTPGPQGYDNPIQYNPQPYIAPTYLPASDNFAAPVSAPDAAAAPSRRYTRDADSLEGGRQITEETQSIFTDLFFRFLGVTTDVCRKRFVCELEFRNPALRGAIRYIG